MYTSINPLKHFTIHRRVIGGGGGRFPWEIVLVPNPSFPETGNPHAVLRTDGLIITNLSRMTIPEGNFTNRYSAMEDGFPVEGESLVVIEIELSSYSYDMQVIQRDSSDASIFKLYKPENAFASQPPADITHARFPIAAIHNNPDARLDDPPAQQFVVKQIVTTAMALKHMCQNGVIFDSLYPI